MVANSFILCSGTYKIKNFPSYFRGITILTSIQIEDILHKNVNNYIEEKNTNQNPTG